MGSHKEGASTRSWLVDPPWIVNIHLAYVMVLCVVLDLLLGALGRRLTTESAERFAVHDTLPAEQTKGEFEHWESNVARVWKLQLKL